MLPLRIFRKPLLDFSLNVYSWQNLVLNLRKIKARTRTSTKIFTTIIIIIQCIVQANANQLQLRPDNSKCM